MKLRVWFLLISLVLLTAGSRTAQMSRAEALPPGTFLHVRTTTPIEPDTSRVGMRYRGIVDHTVVDRNGAIRVPRGSPATLEVVGGNGRDRVALQVVSLHFGRSSYPVATNPVDVKGRSEGKKNTGRKVIGGAGIGAAVGGLLGGGTGAAVGAATGGTAGAIVANKGSGKGHPWIPAETRLQFQLQAPARVPR